MTSESKPTVGSRPSELPLSPAELTELSQDWGMPTADATLRLETEVIEPSEAMEPYMHPISSYEDAAEAVELFLAANAGLAAKSQQAWQRVKEKHAELETISHNHRVMRNSMQHRQSTASAPSARPRHQISERRMRRIEERASISRARQGAGMVRNMSLSDTLKKVLPGLDMHPRHGSGRESHRLYKNR